MAWYTRKEFERELIKELQERLLVEQLFTGIDRLGRDICELRQKGKTPKEISDILNAKERDIDREDFTSYLYSLHRPYIFLNALEHYLHTRPQRICEEVGLYREHVEKMVDRFNEVRTLHNESFCYQRHLINISEFPKSSHPQNEDFGSCILCIRERKL